MTVAHLASQVLGDILRDQGVGSDPPEGKPWPLFLDQMFTDANIPDDAIAVVDIQRLLDGRLHKTGETVGLEQCQVVVRSNKNSVARAKIVEIQNVLDSVVNYEIVVEDVEYLVRGVHRTTTAVFLGPDPNNRVSFVLNCILRVSEAES